MRKLMWFAVGAAGACAIAAYFALGWHAFVLAGVCLLAGGIALFLRSSQGRIVFTVLLGCVIGFLYMGIFDSVYLQTARAYDGKTMQIQVTATDYSVQTQQGYLTDGTLKLDGKTYKTTLFTADESLCPGDVVSGDIRLYISVSDGSTSPTYHQGKGIFLSASPEGDLTVTKAEEKSLRYFPAFVRKWICDTLDRTFPEDTVGFARALLLGDSSKLSPDVDDDLSRSGIRHIIAVSGLHVSILFSLVYVLTDEKNSLNILIGIPVLVLFAAVAGFSPSVVRACVMQGLMIIALAVNREYDPPTALGFSVLVILAFNPMAITSVSFQLSVGSTLGILLFSKKIHDYFKDKRRLGPAKGNSKKSKFIRFFVSGISVTLSAMVFTVPLCAYYFGMVCIFSVLTNLLTLWVVSYIFYGCMLAALLSVIWLPLGQIVAWIVSALIYYVQLIASAVSDIPVSVVYTEDVYILAWLVVSYILLMVFCFSKKKRPLVLTGCVAVCLVVCLGFSAWEQDQGEYSVTVIDVGQGQCVLLENGDEAYLVDCGGDGASAVASKVRSTLLAEGVRELDGIILTHYDADHANAALLLMEVIEVETLYLPDIFCDTDMKDRLLAQSDADTVLVTQDMQLELPNAVLQIFAPAQTKNENDNSLCILFQCGSYDILITGDRAFSGEQALLEKVTLPKVELLIVGHHGSSSSTSLQLLRAIRPDEAVISVGAGNSYGHPTKETLMRLQMFGCRIWRTDINGTIRFRG